MFKLNTLQHGLVNGRRYKNIEHNTTRIRRTKTVSDEVLSDELYSVSDGDMNISTTIHGVTHTTNNAKRES